MTKISIITVCFNAEDTIETTIQSVVLQQYQNIEYLIVDGMSTDSTLSIVEKYSQHISLIISEKDDGIFDAMNKGIQHASGEVLYFLNADDYLYDEYVVRNVMTAFQENLTRNLFYGIVHRTNIPPHRVAQGVESTNQPIYTPYDMFAYGICHQGLFARKVVFDTIGNFDLQYKLTADTDWVLKAYKSGFDIENLNIPLVYYNFTGTSNTYIKLRKREKRSIYLQYFSTLEMLHILIKEVIRKTSDLVWRGLNFRRTRQ